MKCACCFTLFMDHHYESTWACKSIHGRCMGMSIRAWVLHGKAGSCDIILSGGGHGISVWRIMVPPYHDLVFSVVAMHMERCRLRSALSAFCRRFSVYHFLTCVSCGSCRNRFARQRIRVSSFSFLIRPFLCTLHISVRDLSLSSCSGMHDLIRLPTHDRGFLKYRPISHLLLIVLAVIDLSLNKWTVHRGSPGILFSSVVLS